MKILNIGKMIIYDRGRQNMYKNILTFGIILLFVLSAVAPMTTGLDAETVNVDVELERMLDNLLFICSEPSGFNSVKYEYLALYTNMPYY